MRNLARLQHVTLSSTDTTLREYNQCHSPEDGKFCSGGPGDRFTDAGMAYRAGAEGEPINRHGREVADVWLPFAGDGTSDMGRIKHIENFVRDNATTEGERLHADKIARAEYENELAFSRYGKDGTMGTFFRDGQWDPKRQALHNKIIEKALAVESTVGQPVAVLMGGMPASGKSTAAKGLNYADKVSINADDVKKDLPEYTGKNAALVAAESAYLADAIFLAALAQRKSLVYDGTMKTLGDASNPAGLRGRVKALKDAGYRVETRFTDVSVGTSLHRAMTRFAKDGRYVPVGFIKSLADPKYGTKPRATFEAMRREFDAYLLVDNNASDFKPKVLARRGFLTEAARVLEGWSITVRRRA